MVKVAIIGLGSIGQRHVANVLPLDVEIKGYDLRASLLPYLGISTTDDFVAILDWAPTHAIVATPPYAHWAVTDELLDHGVHCFVEKPLAVTEAAGHLLCEKADRNGLTLAVGYQLRAHASLQQFPRQWQRLEIWDYQDWLSWPRPTYSRNLLEEFSHEIDLALWLAGGRAQILGQSVWVYGPKAEIALVTPQGPITVYLDARYPSYSRGARALVGAFVETWTFDKAENQAAYRLELERFLAGQPYCTGRDGVAVLSLLEGWQKEVAHS
jgi:predicted dehydrogenase